MKGTELLLGAFVALSALIFPFTISFFIGGWATKVTSSFRLHHIGDLTGKVALVTGINSGIGRVTAIELAKRGATVLGTVRSADKGKFAEELNLKRWMKGTIVPLVIDLASLQSVRACAKEVLEIGLPINMFILNAAVMMTPAELTVDGFEIQFGTNHLGHFLLTRLLHDKLIEGKARVVVVSSIAHLMSYFEGIRYSTLRSVAGYNPHMAYGQSKLANVLFANELAARLNGTGVTANSLHPGSINSGLLRYLPAAYGGEKGSRWRDMVERVITTGAVVWNNCVSMNAEDGALTQLYVATSPEVEHVSGEYFIPIGKRGHAIHHAKDAAMRQRLWEESEAMVKDFLAPL